MLCSPHCSLIAAYSSFVCLPILMINVSYCWISAAAGIAAYFQQDTFLHWWSCDLLFGVCNCHIRRILQLILLILAFFILYWYSWPTCHPGLAIMLCLNNSGYCCIFQSLSDNSISMIRSLRSISWKERVRWWLCITVQLETLYRLTVCYGLGRLQ